MIEFILANVLILYLFGLYAIAGMNIYRGFLTGKVTWRRAAFWLWGFALIAFLVLDWIMNRTFFWLLCWERPASWRELVTTRMQRYKANALTNRYRRWLAGFVCGLLNAFNFNSEDHC